MPSVAPLVDELRPRRRRSLHVTLLWAAFGLAAVATLLAVHRLHASVQRELHQQAEIATRDQEAKFVGRLRLATDAARQSTIKALTAFHVEGLAHALRRWDEDNAGITGTFQWQPAGGFLPGASGSGTAAAPELVALWRDFRAWRERHPAAASGTAAATGEYRTLWFRLLDNPVFPAGELGYQAENLEMLRYAGRIVDPWAGWAASRNPGSPWIVWYQPGPGAPVRGCLVDTTSLVADLRRELDDSRLARLQLVADAEPVEGSKGSARRVSLDAWLPGFALASSHGDLFVEKQDEARLATLAVAALIGLFLVGAAFLAIFSRREIRDAERKTTFVTQVSHELRTPLTSIRMFADMLAVPELPEAKRARFASTISRESERLSALIERLLMFNTLARGGRGTVTTVDVGDVVRETLEEMEATLQRAGLRLESELPAAGLRVITDHSALKQALLNLLDNAAKYARAGGVVRVSLNRHADEVRLRVADAGPGVPSDLGARIFEPFVQGGQSLTDKSPGVGLGLSIAREGLRQAGGDLVLLPAERGAVFEIRLPAAATS